MDEPLDDAAAFTATAFIDRFQAAAGGGLLPEIEFSIDEQTLTATGNASDRTRTLRTDMRAANKVVAVLSGTVPRRLRGIRGAEIGAALDSFTWLPQAVAAALGASIPAPSTQNTALFNDPKGSFR